MKFSRQTVATILCIAVAAGLLAYSIRAVSVFPRWVVDDSFILFRYAENLATTGELNWNPGENPTEGYTGIALVALLTIAMKVGIPPIVATHIIGIFFFFAGAAVLVLMLRGFNIGSVTALALYLTAPFMYTHVWSGLETTMFSSAILFALYAFLERRLRLFIAAILLLGFVRPEGVLLAVILLALYRPFPRRAALVFIVPAAAYFIWRYAYYGRLLPNTFYAKTAMGKVSTVNWRMVRTFFTKYLPMPALLALIFVSWKKVEKHRYTVIGVVIFCMVVIYNYLSSNLAMNFSYRFMVPFYVLSAYAIGAIMRKVKLTVKTIALVLLLIAPRASTNMNKKAMKNEGDYCKSHYKLLQDEHIKAGEFLKETLSPGEWLIVHADAGAIPYYSKLKTIDFGRLNDEYLARKGLTDDEVVEYFFSINAAAVVFTSYRPDKLDHGPESISISSDPRFENYRLVKKYSTKARRRYHEFVYLRHDLAIGMDEIELAREKSPKGDAAVSPLRTEGLSLSTGQEGAGGAVKIERTINDADRLTSGKSPERLWEMAQEVVSPQKKILYYTMLAKNHPAHELASKSLFMAGFVYSEELSDSAGAHRLFDEFLEKYPASDLAVTAKWMLENMGKPRPDLDEAGKAAEQQR